MRLFIIFGVLALSLVLGAASLQTPRPRPADAPSTTFSAARALIDVREIARRPHPVGSPEHRRVRLYLLERMAALGLSPSLQSEPLSRGGVRRLRNMGGEPAAADFLAVNLVGVLPGRRPDLPAVALMAHYDTVAGSAGAADDSAGVAAVLESVRAIRSRGEADRTLVVLFTDAEEIGLDGARNFWSAHPLRDRIGAVVNLEARGGGGRAMLFETGRGNQETVELVADVLGRIDGGLTSNSLATFVYEQMPNGTDFTVPRDRGVQGLNLAFIGRPEQYHSSTSTPDRLDPGSLQHIGSQALEAADALLRAPVLPAASSDAVHADLFGRIMLVHPPQYGWILLGMGVASLALAARRIWRRVGLQAGDLGRGALDGVWCLSAGLVVAQTLRLVGGPMAGRAESADAYYVLLARLPWIEVGVGAGLISLLLLMLGGRTWIGRRTMALGVGAVAVLGLVLGGFDPILAGAGGLTIALSLVRGQAEQSLWGGWLGLVALVLTAGALLQAIAPAAAFLFVWPGASAAVAAAAASILDPDLERRSVLAALAVIALAASAWLVTLAHPVFLGVGMDLPGALAPLALLAALFLWPLQPDTRHHRLLAAAAGVLLLAGSAASAAGLAAEPMRSAPTRADQG